MNKISLSLRLDHDLVKLIDARKTKTKNRSDVIAELLYFSISNTKSSSDSKSNTEIERTLLQEKAAKASLFTRRMLEVFLKQPNQSGAEVCKKALAYYQKDLQLSASDTQIELETQEFT